MIVVMHHQQLQVLLLTQLELLFLMTLVADGLLLLAMLEKVLLQMVF